MNKKLAILIGVGVVGILAVTGTGLSWWASVSSAPRDAADLAFTAPSGLPDSSGHDATDYAPDPGPGVTSFSYSSMLNLPKTSHGTNTVVCPAGFHVRPGTGSTQGDDTPSPMIKTFVGNTVLMQQWTAPTLTQESAGPGNDTYFQAAEEGYWNAGTSTHHFTMTIWCDKTATTALSGAQPPATPSNGLLSNSGFEGSMLNVGTGTYLAGGAQGSPVTLSQSPTNLFYAGNENGDQNDFYNVVATGIWQTDGEMIGANLGFSGSQAIWYGAGSGLDNGGTLLPVTGDQPNGAQMLVQSNSVVVPDSGNVPNGTVSTGGQCLTASASDGTVSLQTCDASNPYQYWNF